MQGVREAVGNYWQNATTQEFIQALAQSTGIPADQLIQAKSGNSGGTWIHPRVVIHFAQWASAEFAAAVTGWVLELITTGRVELKPEPNEYDPDPMKTPSKTCGSTSLGLRSGRAHPPRRYRLRKFMIRNAAWCVVAFYCTAAHAVAQDGTRTFPEAECSYTLPGNDWVWLNPPDEQNPGLKTIAMARNNQGLVLTIRAANRKPKPDVKDSFTSFEAGLFGSGSMKKVDSKQDTFRGVPSYQITASGPRDSGMRLRIFYAHDRLYELGAVNAGGPIGAEAETEPVFQGFQFTKPVPAPEPAPDGKVLLAIICIAVILVVFVGLIMVVLFLVFLKRRDN